MHQLLVDETVDSEQTVMDVLLDARLSVRSMMDGSG